MIENQALAKFCPVSCWMVITFCNIKTTTFNCLPTFLYFVRVISILNTFLVTPSSTKNPVIYAFFALNDILWPKNLENIGDFYWLIVGLSSKQLIWKLMEIFSFILYILSGKIYYKILIRFTDIIFFYNFIFLKVI